MVYIGKAGRPQICLQYCCTEREELFFPMNMRKKWPAACKRPNTTLVLWCTVMRARLNYDGMDQYVKVISAFLRSISII
ncbi:hypothetical protein SAMN05444955_108185 [Lihuaxuella thermophila]|uniref:Uncharacterized protein n=1 Tax=Lihuaxuella thermophila TaxID=1173111 RepID=A0A1H8FI25_9BACL|nr:hypothetical protein SAMN05444955_108185 [Lihuaxuella thermophila]